jgi:hypothetical protein
MSFSRYATDDSVISSETVVRGLWSGDNNNLSTFFTASGYTEYYLDVYNTGSTASGSSIQFDIQYGNLYGSGSTAINASVPGNTPSRIVYGQYRNLVYGTENTNFSFDGGNTTSNEIFIINISRARYKESLLPGSFNLKLTSGSKTFNLTDDSGTTNLTRFIGENRYYNIISGSNGAYYTTGTPSTYYGLFFPDLNRSSFSVKSTSLVPKKKASREKYVRLFLSNCEKSYTYIVKMQFKNWRKKVLIYFFCVSVSSPPTAAMD